MNSEVARFRLNVERARNRKKEMSSKNAFVIKLFFILIIVEISGKYSRKVLL